ncbi:hypothetical protein GQ44DRAFT_708299 [Phaeosphaeriaceae sp. PMI808]|nr:hypothetical protein GQ44DRAFT_708299 [Phaeosphaeriaceae sp. PMI808]
MLSDPTNYQSQFPHISIDPCNKQNTKDFLRQLGIQEVLDEMKDEFTKKLAQLEERLTEKIETNKHDPAETSESENHSTEMNSEAEWYPTKEFELFSEASEADIAFFKRKIKDLEIKCQVSEATKCFYKQTAKELKGDNDNIVDLAGVMEKLKIETVKLKAKLKKSEEEKEEYRNRIEHLAREVAALQQEKGS